MNEPTIKKKIINLLPSLLFAFAVISSSYLYGVISSRFDLFPNNLVNRVYEELRVLKKSLLIYDLWIYTKTTEQHQPKFDRPEQVQPGLTKITGYGKDGTLLAKIVNQQGSDIHQWNVDWFDVWPDATHIPEQEMPRSRPGTSIHGAIVTVDGGLIYNYEKLGLVRLDACSNVVWRLPRRTHHALFLDEDQHLWVPDLYIHKEKMESWPNHRPPFKEFKILQVSLQGEVLQEFSVMDLIQNNSLQGLFYMQTSDQHDLSVSGDTLHVNDIEIFPASIAEGVFSAGDLMISLRNLNAIMVFSPDNKKLKYLSIGKYVRQHDPDFIDGNTISVFDNNNLNDLLPEPQSRIAIESALDGSVKEYYSGIPGNRFFTKVLGKHQWLNNGNVLITAAMEGRAVEVNPEKNIVWEYYNIVSDDYIGTITEAERLPINFTQQFFENAVKNCETVREAK